MDWWYHSKFPSTVISTQSFGINNFNKCNRGGTDSTCLTPRNYPVQDKDLFDIFSSLVTSKISNMQVYNSILESIRFQTQNICYLDNVSK